MKNPVSYEELIKWTINKNINPRTNRKINSNSKIYKYLDKKFNEINLNKKFSLFDVSNNQEPITLDIFYDEKNKLLVPEDEYIIYQENETKRILALHYTSLIGLKKAKVFHHPITQNKIHDYVFLQAEKLGEKFNYNLSNEISLEQLSLKAFQYFNCLSLFIDHNEFLKLSDEKINKLRFELTSFFTMNLNSNQKKIFKKNKFFIDGTKKGILNEIIFIMENVKESDKIFISYLILAGLVLVIPKLKKDYPFLEYSFPI